MGTSLYFISSWWPFMREKREEISWIVYVMRLLSYVSFSCKSTCIPLSFVPDSRQQISLSVTMCSLPTWSKEGCCWEIHLMCRSISRDWLPGRCGQNALALLESGWWPSTDSLILYLPCTDGMEIDGEKAKMGFRHCSVQLYCQSLLFCIRNIFVVSGALRNLIIVSPFVHNKFFVLLWNLSVDLLRSGWNAQC